MRTTRRSIAALAVALAAAGCEGSTGDGGGAGGAATTTGTSSGADAETPPQGKAELEAWLASGVYKAWACEAAAHDARPGSAHSRNRICSNAAISENASGTASWPKGAAAVKELYATESDTAPTGYAVYLKTADDSADGQAWYWYERIGGSVVADGLGASGSAKSICVGCHSAAGGDPTGGARDFVYTPVD